ncbi:MAG TPA: DUF2922 domain-containing protein [Tissierellaceae bacterium]|nr:DUF2922 domain-containing protein [Tissierellaceae bacterium]
MDRIRLELGFVDNSNKKFRISVDDPKKDLDREAIETAMNDLIEHNVFTSNGEDLKELDGARIITTSVEEMEF